MRFSLQKSGAVLILIFIVSCAGPDFQGNLEGGVTSLYAPEKSPEKVEVLYEKPFRSVIYLGEIRVDSSKSKPERFERFVEEARKKAAKIGADFVEIQKTDELSTPPIPSVTLNPDTTVGESYQKIDPRLSLHEKSITAMTARPGRYAPTKLGIIYDSLLLPRYVIRGFDEQSRGLRAGLRIGDEVILIDGFRLDDPRLAEKTMSVKPGDEAKVVIIRQNTQRVYVLPRIANL